MFGVPNYPTIVNYIESNKNTATYYSGTLCGSCDADVTFCDPIVALIGIIGICTDKSSVPADCAAVALYNGDECNNAFWCSLWLEEYTIGFTTSYQTHGSFSADCSGISSEYPSCTITCKNNVTTAEACSGDIAAPSPGSNQSDAPLSPPSSTVEPTQEPSSQSDAPLSTPSSTAEPTEEPSSPSDTPLPTPSSTESNGAVTCNVYFDTYTYEQIYETLGMFGFPNYTTVVNYIESNKNTANYYSGTSCGKCLANDTSTDSDERCDLFVSVFGICTDKSSDPADCAAVALYNGDECNNASWCSLWLEKSPIGITTSYRTRGSFSADCSGISSEYPSCTITCQNNVTTAEACSGDIAPSPGSNQSDAPLSPPNSTVEPTQEPSSQSEAPVSTPSSTAEPTKEPSSPSDTPLPTPSSTEEPTEEPSSQPDVQTDSAYFGAGSFFLIFFTSVVAGSVIALATGG